MYSENYGQPYKANQQLVPGTPEYDRFMRGQAHKTEDKNALMAYADEDSRGVTQQNDPMYQWGGSRMGGEAITADLGQRRNNFAKDANNIQAYADPGAQYQYGAMQRLQSQMDAPQTMGQLAQQRNMGDAYAAQASAAAGASGGGANAAAASRFAAMNAGQMAARGANDSAMIGMQERQQNLSLMGQLSGQARNAELNRAQYMGNRQDAARDMEKFYQGQYMGGEDRRAQSNLQQEQSRLTLEEAEKQRNANKLAMYNGTPEKPGIGDKLLGIAGGAIGGFARAATGGLL